MIDDKKKRPMIAFRPTPVAEKQLEELSQKLGLNRSRTIERAVDKLYDREVGSQKKNTEKK